MMTRPIHSRTDQTTYVLLAVCGLGLFLLQTGCARRTSVQLATQNMSPGWKLQIVEISEPSEAMVLRKDPMVGVPIGALSKPLEDDKKWLVVKLQITPPVRPKAEPTPSPTAGVPGGVPSLSSSQPTQGPLEAVAALKFAEIQLVSPNGETYSPEAISTGGKFKDNKGGEIEEFLDPKNSEQTFKDSSGRLLMLYQVGSLAFFRSEPQQLSLLFAVPGRASSLSLRL
jgi:hypothetical protein